MKRFIATFVMFTVLAFNAWAQKTETRSVSGFSKVSVGGGYDVYLKQGDTEEVRLEGSTEAMAKIETTVDGDVLKIKQKKSKGWNWDNSGKLKIYVTFKSLTAITSSGSSDIMVESKIVAEDFSLVTSGSSDVEMSLEVNTFKMVLSGSSDVKLSGVANAQTIVVSGSGDIDALDLESNEASVRISGSGNVALHVKDVLDGSVSGSGDIHYRGTPRQKVKISGSGSINSVD